MYQTITRLFNNLLVCLLSSIVISFAAEASDRYDVSYLWSHKIDNVVDYQKQVAQVLGPAVSKHLKLVTKGNLVGLVYHRRGSKAGAAMVARVHTKLLQARDLEAAVPVRSREWTLVGLTESGRSPSKPVGMHQVARKTMTNTQRAKEVRNLELAVEDYIKRLREEGKIAPDERTGWSVYDFTTGEKLVTINEDLQFQAASLVKPFIAAAFFHKVKQGNLVYGRKSRKHMKRMIQHSNNRSTNWVMRKVGGPGRVERILKRHYPGIFKETRVVEYIPAGGRTYRNKASIHDYSRFLYALWKEEIAGATEIKRLMSLSRSNRIYTGAQIPEGTDVFNKTGSTSRLCGDMGILIVKGRDGKRYPYTLIGVIEKQQPAQNYTRWIRARANVIRNVSNIVYKGIAQHHDFGSLDQSNPG